MLPGFFAARSSGGAGIIQARCPTMGGRRFGDASGIVRSRAMRRGIAAHLARIP